MPARIDPSDIPHSPDLNFEIALWSHDLKVVAGVDEAGRGAWAGPVVAAVVVFPADSELLTSLSGVRDSKQLKPEKRAELAPMIKKEALAWSVGSADNTEIDQIGILPATRLAMMRAIKELTLVPQHLLIDALFLPDLETSQTALIKGDQRSFSIAAASILAKTSRDEWMVHIHDSMPAFQFARHKGYGTKAHREALMLYGSCQIHRQSFIPIMELNQNGGQSKD